MKACKVKRILNFNLEVWIRSADPVDDRQPIVVFFQKNHFTKKRCPFKAPFKLSTNIVPKAC